MDNKVKTKYKQSKKNDLIQERQKTVTNCLNLECKNEQLKVLIDRLNNLANKRENLLFNDNDKKQNTKEENQLFIKKSNISEELKIAQENSEKLEKAISSLKNKISTIDQKLSQ